MSETDILQSIRLALGKRPDVLIFRNNNGKLQDKEGRWVTFGLGPGSADLIGFVTVSGIAVFVAIEVKTRTGQPTVEQINFINAVLKSGGRAGIARSVEDAEKIIAGIV